MMPQQSSTVQHAVLRVLSGLPGGLRAVQCREVIQPRPTYSQVWHALEALQRQGLVRRVSPGRYARVGRQDSTQG